MVYVDLTRFLVTEDEKLYDNHPLVGTVRGDPTETPAYGDPTLDVQLRAFASEGVLELVEDWRKSVSIVVRLMGQIEQEADYGAKLDLERERNDYSGYSHETVVKIQRLVRLELSPQPHSG